MATITSPLSDENKKVTGEALQGALVDLVDLSLQAKQQHWNLIGKRFRSVHLHLDEVVEVARNHMDILAERAIAIGVNPDGRSETVAKSSELQTVTDGYISDDEVIAHTADVLFSICKRFRDRIEATESADPVSQDLLIAASEDLEQQHWMFQAQQ